MFELSVGELQEYVPLLSGIIIKRFCKRGVRELANSPFSRNRLAEVLESLNLERTKCPHCGSRNFIRHGRTRTCRQRYRCRECRRTFSETTGTPFMYSKKKPGTWASYLLCMEGGMPLRKISKLLGISLSTAFSWRHKILSAAGTRIDNILTENIEVHEFSLRENFKGSRRINPRFFYAGNRRLIVMLSCCDSQENILVKTAARKGWRNLVYEEISGILTPIVKSCKTFISSRNIAFASFAKQQKAVYCMPYSPKYRLEDFTLKNAEQQSHGFKGFLKGFRSVASKYLTHYANWYKLILKSSAGLPAEVMGMLSCCLFRLKVYEFEKVQFDGTIRYD